MRVLVVDPEDGFAKQVTALGKPAGAVVTHAASPEQMRAHMRMRSFDAVLVDLSRRRMDGFEVAREIRRTHPASDVEIILVPPTSERESNRVRTLREEVGGRFVLEKPVSLEGLLEALHAPKPTSVPQGGQPRAEGVVARGGSARRGGHTPKKLHRGGEPNRGKDATIDATNLLLLTDVWSNRKSGTLTVSGPVPGTALVSQGGIVDDQGKAVIVAALRGGTVSFADGVFDDPGDWKRLGRVLFKRTRSACDARTLRRYLNALVTKTETTTIARLLPLSDGARAFVGAVDGRSTVNDILGRANLAVGDVSKEVIALTRMGLIAFDRRDRKQSSSEHQGLPRSARGGERLPGDRDSDRRQRLQREYAVVEGAPPPVVLGVPSDASRDLVARAAERMHRRYAELASRSDLDPESRTIAQKMVRRVDLARRNFNFDATLKTGGSAGGRGFVDEVEEWLIEGKALLVKREWAAADKVLARAHHKRIDHPAVLANLGWARLHNPDVDAETRTEEGRDFLLLAEQFDPMDADGQFYLAQVLLAANRLEAAEERAERAAKAAPSEPTRQALVRTIRTKRRLEEERAQKR
ncbi:MAG: response regulator [Myxococcota bacterium]|nr:response regulator [Myxococcota bacterium]